MPHVAFVSTMTVAPWGGSEELWQGAALRLRQENFGVSANVQHWTPPPPPVQALTAAGVQVTARQFKHRMHALLGARYARRVYGWLAAGTRPDLVVISEGFWSEGLAWMEACEAHGLPFLTVTQAAGVLGWPDDAKAGRLAAAYKAARACCFVSIGNLELARAQLASDLPNARIVFNPYSVPFDATPPWPSEAEGVKLACIGRLSPEAKGQDVLFDVLRQDKWRARPLSVTLYGDGPNRETLQQLARLYDLGSVRFGGFTGSVANVWAEHHALVLPSRHEGLPLTVVEAMLCGRPCIVTDVAGAGLVQDAQSGFVTAAATAPLLDDALERAWGERASWREMGQAASQRARATVPADPVGEFVALLKQWMF